MSFGGYGPIDAAVSRLGVEESGTGNPLGFDPLQGVGLRPESGGYGATQTMGLRGMPPVGTDLFMDIALPTWQAQMEQKYPTQQAGGQGFQTGGSWSGTGSGVSTAGGNWAALDAHNPEIATAANAYGVPANLLKSMINRESSGNWEANNYTNPSRGSYMYPFVGVFAEAAQSVGFDPAALAGNKQMQINAMAAILARDYKNYGSWEAAASNYLTGDPQAYLTGGTDSAGLPADYYVQKAMEGWHYLDQQAGTTTAGSQYLSSAGGWGGAGGAAPSDVINAATSYVNVAPYVWGSVPGAGQDPATSGWDCSGMISWLSSKYAPNSGLPAGSHYQYEWAKNSGNLFTDPSQLKPGDIVFFDTGGRAGGGAYLNGASHVGMYIGNGKMVHAANPSAGTIISDFASYQGMYGYLGAAHMPWSGGAAYSGAGGGAATGGAPAQTQASTMSPSQIWLGLLSGQNVPGY